MIHSVAAPGDTNISDATEVGPREKVEMEWLGEDGITKLEF